MRTKASDTFTQYVPQTPPQRAQGDFDGDGRIDTALIQDHAGTARISIQLSGSSMAVDLEPTVTGVVQSDVDHDGDLDLIAETPSGDLLIWINDGHGRFTRQPAAPRSGVSGEPAVTEAASSSVFAIDARAPSIPSPTRRETDLVAAPVRSSASRPVHDLPNATLPPLRAPPRRSV